MCPMPTHTRTLITGDYPVVREVFAAEIGRVRASDKLAPVLVLVSSHLVGLHLQRYLAERDLPHMNIRFLTLEDFAESLAGPKFAADGLTRVSSLAARQIIRACIAERTSRGGSFYFSRVADKAGFHDALLATIGDLKDAGLSPDTFGAALNRAAPGGLNRAKLSDIHRIWDAYDDRLHSLGWFDAHDVMREATKIIGRSLDPGHTAVIIYGFYDFNMLEKRLIKACSAASNVTALVPYEPTPAFEYAVSAISWFRANGFEVSEPGPLRSETRSQPVQHLCDHLFSRSQAGTTADGLISILSAPGEVREVREAVREIVREAGRREIALHQIGILLRNSDPYASLFREALEHLGFKPYVAEGIPLSATRPGRSLLLLLDMLHHDFAREAVMEFVTFARLKPDKAGKDNELDYLVPLWDVISMEAGIVGGAGEWLNRLRLLTEAPEPEGDESEQGTHQLTRSELKAARALHDFIERAAANLETLRDARSWAEKSASLIASFKALVKDDEHSDDTVAAVGNLGCLDKIGVKPSEADFHRAVREVLDTSGRETGRFERNGPAVIGLMPARGIPFKMVVIPGMVEKSFPPLVRQDALLLDEERGALNAALAGSDSGPLAPKARLRIEEERLLFRLTVGAAERRVVFTYPRLDAATGRERLPSSFMLEAVRAATGQAVDFSTVEMSPMCRRIRLAEMGVTPPEHALDEVEYDLSRALEDIASGRPLYVGHLRGTNAVFGRALRLEASRWGQSRFTIYDGMIRGDEALRCLRERHSLTNEIISPTKLQTYARCPFRYFLETVLGIKAPVAPERAVTISSLDKGDLIHRVLWEFMSRLRDERGSPVSVCQEDKALLHEVAEARFRDFEARGVTGYPPFWRLEKQHIREWLDLFLDEEMSERDFLPAYFEVRYGTRPHGPHESDISTEEPVPFDAGESRFFMRGRIDRIDVSQDLKSLRVRDYKTGKPSAKPNDFGGGTNLQLPLYLIAAEHLVARIHPGITAGYAEYYHIAAPSKGKRHIPFDRETLDAMREALNRILNTIAEAVTSGHFFARPDGCKNCEFTLVCGSAREALFYLKCKDPAVEQVLTLAEQEHDDSAREDSDE
jgi:ATP-dependent helicase/nuclease subunit B